MTDLKKLAGSPLGEILVSLKKISRDRLEVLLREQEFQATQNRKRIGELAVELEFITEKDLAQALAVQNGCEYFDLKREKIDIDLARQLKSEVAEKYRVIPLFKKNNVLYAGTCDPNRYEIKDHLQRFFPDSKIAFKSVEVTALYFKLQEIYDDLSAYEKLILEGKKLIKEIEMTAGRGSEVRKMIPDFMKHLLMFALVEEATDIHLVSDGESLRVFFRVSSRLRHYFTFPAALYEKIAGYVKTESGLDPGDRMHFQDGSMTFKFGVKVVDLRVSVVPTVPPQDGASIVLRLLDKTRVILDLRKLGFFPEDAERIREAANLPYGLLLITGPTGSGKTTTLYAALKTRDPFSCNILTVENPVEYRIPGIRQVQVNEKSGVTFASALRSFLRQDPDVILVGEIRDPETAETALYSAMTGHVVLSTLHTNDACSVIPRLLEYKLDPSVLSSSLSVIVAQRLVRTICPHCRSEREPSSLEKKTFNKIFKKIPKKVLYGKGCSKCFNTGYLGVTNIYEILEVTPEMRHIFNSKVSSSEIREHAIKTGFTSLFYCGLKKVIKGYTTLEEVMRVSRQ